MYLELPYLLLIIALIIDWIYLPPYKLYCQKFQLANCDCLNKIGRNLPNLLNCLYFFIEKYSEIQVITVFYLKPISQFTYCNKFDTVIAIID